MSRWEPPILLTQICSFWRNVAHATPQLWKSIHIVGPYNKSVRYSGGEYSNSSSTTVEHYRTLEAVVEWLTRSAAHPLDISLGYLGLETSTVNEFYFKIIESLIQFSERWREIRLSAPHLALLPIASLPLSKVPLLEALSFNCYYHHGYSDNLVQPDPQWITSGVLNTPNLRDFGLSLTYLNWDVTRLPIDWSQLTNLSLEGFSFGNPSPLSISRAYKLLSFCRNLITCRLEIGDYTEDGELPLEATTALISLPFLTQLSVREELTSLSRLFTLLHLPSLNSIEFHTAIEPTRHYESTPSILSLLTRFGSTIIIKLVTDARFYTRQDFIKCLRLCPLLKTLFIRKSAKTKIMDLPPDPDADTCKIDDAFLKLFFEPSNQGYLCPHLEHFEISSMSAFSETTLLQFVKEKNGDTSSTTGLAKLKNLSVAFDVASGPLLGDIKQELEPYEQAGLVSSLSYPLKAPYSAFDGLHYR